MSDHRSSIHVRLTRLGWQFAFIAVFAMVGGAIRAYNLPLVLAGLVVAALVIQWRWSRQTLLGVKLERRLPDEAFAGEPFTIRFLVTNRSGWLPAWLVRIDDAIGQRPTIGVRSWFRPWRVEPVRGMTTARCGLGVILSRSTLTTSYQCLITRRGRYDFGPATVSTGAPLGLMLASRPEPLPQSLYVFPRLLTLRHRWRNEFPARIGGNATAARRHGGHDGEFFGIRGWRNGDSRRWIHWRTTARIGEPAVRQYEQTRRFDLCVLVDAYLPSGIKPRGVIEPTMEPAEETLEWVISAAATLVMRLGPTPANRIGLVVAGRQTRSQASGGGREQTIAMLRQLTELSGTDAPDLAEAIRQVLRIGGKPRDLIVLSPRPSAAAPNDLFRPFSTSTTCRWLSAADGTLGQLVAQPSAEAPQPMTTDSAGQESV